MDNEDANCKCCGRLFRRSWMDTGVDYNYCSECADNKVWGLECDWHDIP
jgi:hypothetical protein